MPDFPKLSRFLSSLLILLILLDACGDSPLQPAPASMPATSAASTIVTTAVSGSRSPAVVTVAIVTTAGEPVTAAVAPPTVIITTAMTTTEKAAAITVAQQATTATAPETTTVAKTEAVTTIPPAKPTIEAVAGLGKIVFEIDADLPANQAEIIRKGIALAQKELGLVPEFTIQAGNSVELPVKVDGTFEHDFSGVANGSGIQYYTSASAWKDDDPKGQYATVVHEYFHMVQYYLAKTSNDPDSGENMVDRDGPQWIGEGSANFMSARVLARAGIYPYVDYKKEALNSAVTLKMPLKEVETAAQKTLNEPAAYDLGFLALDFMDTKYGNSEQNLKKYYTLIGIGTKWEAAFQKAFNISIADFYKEFERYRSEKFPAP